MEEYHGEEDVVKNDGNEEYESMEYLGEVISPAQNDGLIKSEGLGKILVLGEEIENTKGHNDELHISEDFTVSKEARNKLSDGDKSCMNIIEVNFYPEPPLNFDHQGSLTTYAQYRIQDMSYYVVDKVGIFWKSSVHLTVFGWRYNCWTRQIRFKTVYQEALLSV